MTKQDKMIAIGHKIQSIRQSKGLTQLELSKTTGLSRTYISDVENGRYMPSVQALSVIAKSLDLDLNFIKQMTEIQEKEVQNE